MSNLPNLTQSVMYKNKIWMHFFLIAQPEIFQIYFMNPAKSRDIGEWMGTKRSQKWELWNIAPKGGLKKKKG